MPRTSDQSGGGWQGVGHAWTYISILASGILVWGGAGYGLDHVFHTRPVLMAIGMVLGYGGASYSIYRRSFVEPGATRKGEPKA